MLRRREGEKATRVRLVSVPRPRSDLEAYMTTRKSLVVVSWRVLYFEVTRRT